MKTRGGQFGGTIFEAIFSLPIFLLILLSASNLAVLGYKAAGLHYTLAAASRWAVLGKTISGQSRVQSIKSKVQEIGSGYGLSLPADSIFVCGAGFTSCAPESAGDPDSYIQLSATEPATMFFGLYSVNLSYSVLGRNEPYA